MPSHDGSLADYSQDLALPALFNKSWDAHEDQDSLTDAQIEVCAFVTRYLV